MTIGNDSELLRKRQIVRRALMTSVSFVSRCVEQENRAFLRMDEVALAIKTSFRYDERLVATHHIERRFFMSNDDKSLAHTRWKCKYYIGFTPKYRRKVNLWTTTKRYWKDTE